MLSNCIIIVTLVDLAATAARLFFARDTPFEGVPIPVFLEKLVVLELVALLELAEQLAILQRRYRELQPVLRR